MNFSYLHGITCLIYDELPELVDRVVIIIVVAAVVVIATTPVRSMTVVILTVTPMTTLLRVLLVSITTPLPELIFVT
uniref:Uncharacterized protein n=1 Tax=Tanacetum cinerariifolium TaxID=118510 RepID=A0A699VM48_TANCI|nr:hypothetical protein [Tanacetum cinerariifolium]